MTAPVLVTGASGLLGGAIVARAALRTTVVGVSRRDGPWLRADVGSPHELASVLDEVQPGVVVHAAGCTRGTPAELEDGNVGLLETVLDEAARRELPVVVLGSAAEYGDPGSARPLGEDDTPCPVSPYGRSKLDASRGVVARRRRGEPVTVARLFTLVGPGIPSDQVVGELSEKVQALPERGGVVSVGNADVVRDVVTVDFAADAVLALARARPPDPIINVCSGAGIRLGDFVAALARHRGVDATVESRGEPAIMTVVGDPSRLRSATGLDGRLDLPELAAAALGQTA